MLSSKSPSPAWEEISEVGPEPEADNGLDKIHASRRGKAADQCCVPCWLALALASTKDRLNFPHCLEVHSPQMLQGFSKSSKNRASSKMAPRREKGELSVREWSRGHATSRGVAVKDLKGPDKHNAFLGLSI